MLNTLPFLSNLPNIDHKTPSRDTIITFFILYLAQHVYHKEITRSGI